MDGCGPLGAEQVGDGEFEQQIAQGCRVQDGSVEEGDSRPQGSIAHAKFLRVCGEIVERFAAGVVGGVLMGKLTLDVVPVDPLRVGIVQNTPCVSYVRRVRFGQC